jgi:uncharacterized membrane protein (UPF0182 family)
VRRERPGYTPTAVAPCYEVRVMRKKLLYLLAVLLVLAAVLTVVAQFWTEYAWFDHLGFSSVFAKRLLTKVGMGVGFGVVALAFLGVQIVLIRRNSKPRAGWSIPTASGEVIDVGDMVKRVGTPIVAAAAVAAAAAMGYWASRHWEEMLKFLNRTDFGTSEPILGQDVGFYLFSLPVMQFVQEWLVYLTGIGAVLVAVVYFSRGAVTVQGKELEWSQGVRSHLLWAVALILGVLAWGWRLEMFETLFSKRGVAYGATYTDVYVNLVVYRVMIGACLAVAVYLVYLTMTKPDARAATRRPAYALASVVGLYLLGAFVAPTVIQQFVVNPNELDKEKPYLAHAIAGTRAAYALEKIEMKEFPSNDQLSIGDLQANRPTIDNIKIWDHRPLRSTYKQMQAIRLYYDFPSITVDRYQADNAYWQVMLSPRELVIGQLPEQSQTWVNRHLQYTHGYGVVLSPVKRVVGEGLPDLWIKDIPPQSRYPHLDVTRPEIYFGQETQDYALVRTTTKEFDYPKGSENAYTTYEGKGGIGIGSFFRRVLFAIREADVNLLFTKYLTPESRIMIYRNVQERVDSIAPFLMLDQEPYMVVADGRLYWVLDAYTISYRYPYSQPTALDRRSRKRLNYVRNSVKAVVDAYHGTVSLYLWDESDPMIKTYAKIFPSLFKPKSEMPTALRAHVRYPKDLFTLQSMMYESFHMTDPQIFYNQEDKWAVSRELGEKTIGRQKDQSELGAQPGVTAKQATMTARMDPYYMIMRLPEEKREEYLLMVPYTPVNKDNMVAWMTARCDGDDYGRLLVYTFPKQKLVFGPMQIEARIDQDEHISQWITLRNQQGSTVIRGDLLVIPIKDSILYVEPIYLQSTQTQLPELKQVVVSFGKMLTMKDTLQEGLQVVFGIKDPRVAQALVGERALSGEPASLPATRPVPTEVVAPPGVAIEVAKARTLLEQAMGHYEAAQQKVAKGDWAGYGAEQQALKKSLEGLAAEIAVRIKPPAPEPKVAPKPAPRPAPKPAP